MNAKHFESALQDAIRLQTDHAKLGKLVEDSSVEARILETAIDLFDPKALTRICNLQVVNRIGPIRMASLEAEEARSKAGLIKASHKFITETFRPRFIDLERRALEKVEARLKASFEDKAALRAAAHQSTELSSLALIEPYKTITVFDPDESIPYARALLNAWRAADEFEGKFLAQP